MIRLVSTSPAVAGLAVRQVCSPEQLKYISKGIGSLRQWHGTSWPVHGPLGRAHMCSMMKMGEGARIRQDDRAGIPDMSKAPRLIRCHCARNFPEDSLPADEAWVSTSGEEQSRLLLIDGYPVVYRAYFKLLAKMHHGKLKDSHSDGNGDSVLTVFLALSSILRFLDLLPSHVAVVFDFRGTTFRHTIQPSYKAGRPPTPDTVNEAAGYLKAALVAMAIPVLEVPGVEADDVIGTLGVQAVAAGMKVRVASVDSDFYQILSPSLRLLKFLPRGSGAVSFGIEDFKKKFGNLEPAQYADVLALVGDKVDNVPGVRGVGQKTAVKLIVEHGSLESLLQQAERVPLKRIRESLLLHRQAAILSKQLACLRLEIPRTVLKCSVQDLVFHAPEDGGRKYKDLLAAMGKFADASDSGQLWARSEQMWESLSLQRVLVSAT